MFVFIFVSVDFQIPLGFCARCFRVMLSILAIALEQAVLSIFSISSTKQIKIKLQDTLTRYDYVFVAFFLQGFWCVCVRRVSILWKLHLVALSFCYCHEATFIVTLYNIEQIFILN